MGRLGKSSGLQQSQDLRLSVLLKIPVALLNPAQDGVEEWGQKNRPKIGSADNGLSCGNFRSVSSPALSDWEVVPWHV